MSGLAALKLRNAEYPEITTITPELAASLLEHNHLNRPLSDAHVKRIAAQILADKWKFNGDTIKISVNNEVLDGQHRLWAIIEAKQAVETILVRGIERDAFSTIDTLRRPRSGGDVIALNGTTRYRNIISSALQWLWRWQHGCLEKYKDPKFRIENSDIEAMFTAHPQIIRAIESAAKLRSLANPALVGFFYYILTNRNEHLAEQMMATLENPAGVSITDPYFKLRVYFLEDSHKRKDALYSIALMIKASNAAYRGQKVQVLLWRSQGERPEAFPLLEVND